jgi:hypothetical protein
MDSRSDLSFSSAEIFAIVRPIGMLQASVVLYGDITEDHTTQRKPGLHRINFSAVYSGSRRSYRVFPGARCISYRGLRYSFDRRGEMPSRLFGSD